MKNTLCLYYTRTGTTKALMEQIAQKLDAELVEYTDGKSRAGAYGYLTACLDSFKKPLPRVKKPKTERPLSEYEKVVIAMPIWAENCCAVGRGLLEKYRDELPEQVYFVITHMADSPYDKAIAKLDNYLNSPNQGWLSVSTRKDDLAEEIESFVELVNV